MVQLLLANGADPNIASVNKPGKQSIKRGGSSNSSIAVFGKKGSLGETPLDNAVVAGTARVVAALVGAGADPTLTGSFPCLHALYAKNLRNSRPSLPVPR